MRLLPRFGMQSVRVVTCLVAGTVLSSICMDIEAAKITPEAAKQFVCPVHHLRTATDHVPIVYGYRPVPSGYIQAQQTSFPNAWSHVPGGCVMLNPTDARVRYCPKCREAEKEWRSAHPRKPGSSQH